MPQGCAHPIHDSYYLFSQIETPEKRRTNSQTEFALKSVPNLLLSNHKYWYMQSQQLGDCITNNLTRKAPDHADSRSRAAMPPGEVLLCI